MQAAYTLTAYWIAYFFLHSLLASLWFKAMIERHFNSFYQYYRIMYNAFSLVGLLYIFWFLTITPSSFVWPKSELLQFVSLMLATWGIIFLRLSFKQYSMKKFLGAQSESLTDGLVIEGVLKRVRHPIYTGTLLITFSLFMFNPSLLNLVTFVCVFIYILIGIQLEEKKLIKQFGEEYLEYKNRVPMLIPRLTLNED